MNLRRTIKNILLPLFLTGRLFAGDNQSIRNAVYNETEDNGPDCGLLMQECREMRGNKQMQADKKPKNFNQTQVVVSILGQLEKFKVYYPSELVERNQAELKEQCSKRVLSSVGIYDQADFGEALRAEYDKNISSQSNSQKWTAAAINLMNANGGALLKLTLLPNNEGVKAEFIDPNNVRDRIFVLPLKDKKVMLAQLSGGKWLDSTINGEHVTAAKQIITNSVKSLLQNGDIQINGKTSIKTTNADTPFVNPDNFKNDIRAVLDAKPGNVQTEVVAVSVQPTTAAHETDGFNFMDNVN